jgi:hypothetical protein
VIGFFGDGANIEVVLDSPEGARSIWVYTHWRGSEAPQAALHGLCNYGCGPGIVPAIVDFFVGDVLVGVFPIPAPAHPTIRIDTTMHFRITVTEHVLTGRAEDRSVVNRNVPHQMTVQEFIRVAPYGFGALVDEAVRAIVVLAQ